MTRGKVLVVVATDPMAAIDFPHFCSEQGHILESQAHDGDVYKFTIRRG